MMRSLELPPPQCFPSPAENPGGLDPASPMGLMGPMGFSRPYNPPLKGTVTRERHCASRWRSARGEVGVMQRSFESGAKEVRVGHRKGLRRKNATFSMAVWLAGCGIEERRSRNAEASLNKVFFRKTLSPKLTQLPRLRSRDCSQQRLNLVFPERDIARGIRGPRNVVSLSSCGPAQFLLAGSFECARLAQEEPKIR